MDYEPKSFFSPDLVIERAHRPDATRIKRNFFAPQVPAIFTGSMEDWPCLSRWSNAYFKEKAGHRVLLLSQAHDGQHFEKEKVIDRAASMSLSKYVERIEKQELREGQLYAAQIPLREILPELWEDIGVPVGLDPKVCAPNLWLGPGGNVTPLHYDEYNNFLAQLRGRKTVLLFPPGEIKNLYPFSFQRSASHVSRINIASPDLVLFPRLKKAHCAVVRLEPGEILFIPRFWWHAVFGHELNVSLNYWWTPSIKGFPRYPRQELRRMARSNLHRLREVIGKSKKVFFQKVGSLSLKGRPTVEQDRPGPKSSF